MIPDDLAGRWHLTEWSLALNAWNLHIALCVYPIPLCFGLARQYEAKIAKIEAQRREMTQKHKRPKAKPQPKEQLGLWRDNGGLF